MQDETIDKRLGDWSDERVESLKQFFEAGLSAGQIATEIGHGVTRNMVCGKLSRLGLKRVSKETLSASQTQPGIISGIQVHAEKGTVGSKAGGIIARIKARIHDTAAQVVPLTVVHDAADTKPVHIGLMELTEETCRWPYAEEGSPTTYCGCTSKPNSPYCYEHHAVAYHKRAERPISNEERERRVNQWRANAELKRRSERKAQARA